MKNKRRFNPPPFKTIEAATQGDVFAINAVLRHYDGLIASLSVRPMTDELGGVHMVIDPDMRRHLETRLITRILKFQVA